MGKIFSLFATSRNSFEALLAPHVEHLHRLAYRFTGSTADAEDLVQELLTKLYTRQEMMAGVEPLRPWLVRSLHNLHIDQVRRRMRERLVPITAEMEAVIPDPGSTPDRECEQEQFFTLLQRAVEKLSEEYRSVVILHDMEGYQLPELAQILDLPLGTLKSRLHRARQRLREELEKEPFALAARISE